MKRNIENLDLYPAGKLIVLIIFLSNIALWCSISGFCESASDRLTMPVVWDIDQARQVIQPGQLFGDLDASCAGACHVIQVGNRYRMYYWAGGADGSRICIAESPVEDPNAWESVKVALERQPENVYNEIGPGFPFVVPRNDGPWMMYFCGWGRTKEDGMPRTRAGLARSHDKGLTWEYIQDAPIIPSDRPWDAEGTGSVHVLYESGLFRMYYTSKGSYYPRPEGVETGHGDTIPDIGIGYAISDDGMNWTKPLHHWLIGPRRFTAEPYEYICSKPCIVREDKGYRMWVNTFSTRYRIRSLWSTNGMNWHWNPSPPDGELGVGPEGAFDDEQRSYISVVKYKDEYRCWFTGNGFGANGMGYTVGYVGQHPKESRGIAEKPANENKDDSDKGENDAPF